MGKLQKHRNKKQEGRSAGEREKKMLYRNTGTRNAKENSRNASAWDAKLRRNIHPSLGNTTTSMGRWRRITKLQF